MWSHMLCEILQTPDSSMTAEQSPSPEPSAECVVSEEGSSPLSVEGAHCVPSPEHATDTQPGAFTLDHVVCTQQPPLCTRAGRPVKPPA